MDWKKCESTEILPAIDDTSSEVYVYLYKNMTEIERKDEQGRTEKLYQYDYLKIKKEIYDYVRELWATEDRTTEIEDVLAELLFGGDKE